MLTVTLENNTKLSRIRTKRYYNLYENIREFVQYTLITPLTFMGVTLLTYCMGNYIKSNNILAEYLKNMLEFNSITEVAVGCYLWSVLGLLLTICSTTTTAFTIKDVITSKKNKQTTCKYRTDIILLDNNRIAKLCGATIYQLYETIIDKLYKLNAEGIDRYKLIHEVNDKLTTKKFHSYVNNKLSVFTEEIVLFKVLMQLEVLIYLSDIDYNLADIVAIELDHMEEQYMKFAVDSISSNDKLDATQRTITSQSQESIQIK